MSLSPGIGAIKATKTNLVCRCGAGLFAGDLVRRISPVVVPGGAHHVRVFRPAEAAVVASQGAVEVALFDVQIVAQDGAAKPQVGAQVEKVVVRAPDQFDPERHDLHVAACAC